MDNLEFELDNVFDLTESAEAASPEGGSPGEAAEPTESITETVSDVPFLDKPFNEYSANEALLLLILGVALLSLIHNIFRSD